METRWRGCGTALVTPFTKSGSIDEVALKRLTNWQIDRGINFLVPCGTTGESPTLSQTEKLRVIEIVITETNKRVPVLAGVGGADTQSVIQLAKDVESLEPDGLLSVTPYYNKPSPAGIYQHFRAIAENVKLPVIIYNVPNRTGCNINPETLFQLADIPNIIGVKEASGNLDQICTICRDSPDEFCVLSGDDAFTLALLALGGSGVISVVSNEAPSEMTRLVSAALDSDFVTARNLHHRLLPLMQINFVESNPIPVKAALAEMGLIEECYRLPLVPPTQTSRKKIIKILNDLGLSGKSL